MEFVLYTPLIKYPLIKYLAIIKSESTKIVPIFLNYHPTVIFFCGAVNTLYG